MVTGWGIERCDQWPVCVDIPTLFSYLFSTTSRSIIIPTSHFIFSKNVFVYNTRNVVCSVWVTLLSYPMLVFIFSTYVCCLVQHGTLLVDSEDCERM